MTIDKLAEITKSDQYILICKRNNNEIVFDGKIEERGEFGMCEIKCIVALENGGNYFQIYI